MTKGGDRKGLPSSFHNRLSKVFMAALSPGDLGLICSSLYSAVALLAGQCTRGLLLL